MKTNWLVLLVAGFVLLSLPLYATGENEVQVEAAAAPGEPQYGGSVTVINAPTDKLGNPDRAYGSGPVVYWINHVCEKIHVGDVYQYGARGTGEFTFSNDYGLPLKYKKGGLVESWDITPDAVVFNFRKGVYWSGLSINSVMEEKREYTAEDYVFNLSRRLAPDAPQGSYFRGIEWVKEPYEEHIYAKDKYTAVIETNYFHADWDGILQGGGGQQCAPETVQAGPDKWENVVGTGPFYIKDYVPGSHIGYGKNPHYWQKAPIGGKEYDTPFLDEMTIPLIKDEATVVAALRTATLDAFLQMHMPHVASLDKTNPELEKHSFRWGLAATVALKLDQPPFDDIDVRRALFIGTNRAAVSAMVMEQDPVYHMWPMGTGWEGWGPIEDLPASAQELYTYDPEKAEQMLADAGYPNGFKIKMLTSTRWQLPDIAQLLAANWSEYGIEVEIETGDVSVVRSRGPKQDYEDTFLEIAVTHTPILFANIHYGTKGTRNWPGYGNEYVDSRLSEAVSEIDDAKRIQKMEEAFVRITEDVPAIPMALPPIMIYWWPWVQNFVGETWYHIHSPDYHNWWLDQDLKKQMGH